MKKVDFTEKNPGKTFSDLMDYPCCFNCNHCDKNLNIQQFNIVNQSPYFEMSGSYTLSCKLEVKPLELCENYKPFKNMKPLKKILLEERHKEMMDERNRNLQMA